ncbi:hypothetical protein Ddye_000922 [Dipteronia dyeriana]|uniref:Uncharacterized protein n=1 Tax=Dipteronia dyeriana TaxID=168575 RepID=A0AAD9XNX8_9ROSI|nr:hypothetical protein Ddye_000922 [Dipteronia dyeriana]
MMTARIEEDNDEWRRQRRASTKTTTSFDDATASFDDATASFDEDNDAIATQRQGGDDDLERKTERDGKEGR